MYKYTFNIAIFLAFCFVLISTILLILLIITAYNKKLSPFWKKTRITNIMIPLPWTIILSVVCIIGILNFSPCSNCGEFVRTDYCLYCGESILENKETFEPNCPNCGISVKSPFCGDCGAKIN